MHRRLAIATCVFLILSGLAIWGILSGRRQEKETVPEVLIPVTAGRDTEVVKQAKTTLPVSALPAPQSSVRKPHPNKIQPDKRQDTLTALKSSSVSIKERRQVLANLAEQGDAESAAVLMALGDERTYLNSEAVEALGTVKPSADVTQYLRGKLGSDDPIMLCAALKSIAAQEGTAAISDIAAALRANRKRPDGFQDRVCAACVDALGHTGSPQAIPVLDAELRETVGPFLGYDYGSRIVGALSEIGHFDAIPVLNSYADRLEKMLTNTPKDNPQAERYIQSKIKEAKEAAMALGGS